MTRASNGRVGAGLPSGGSSHLISILVVILCVLSAIVIGGGYILFTQRNKADTLQSVSLESDVAEITSAGGTSTATTGAASGAPGTASAKANKASGGAHSAPASDPCQQIPLVYGHGRLAFSQEEADRYQDEGESTVTLVLYCDGKWAKWGQYGTDNGSGPEFWNGSEWEALEPDVDSTSADERCWEASRLEELGVPEYIKSKTRTCSDSHSYSEGSSSGGSSGSGSGSSHTVTGIRNPSCDNGYILIVSSVVVTDGQDPQAAVQSQLANYAGAYVAEPGACPSLRAIEPSTGGEIYPIYYDYDFDVSAACAARSHFAGSNVRRMTNVSGDYYDPCV